MNDPCIASSRIHAALQLPANERADYLSERAATMLNCAAASESCFKLTKTPVLSTGSAIGHPQSATRRLSNKVMDGQKMAASSRCYKLLQQIGEGGVASSIWRSRKNRFAAVWRSR